MGNNVALVDDILKRLKSRTGPLVLPATRVAGRAPNRPYREDSTTCLRPVQVPKPLPPIVMQREPPVTAAEMSAPFVSIDFEARSVINLMIAGAYRYSEDEWTQVYCMAYRFGDNGPIRIWILGQPCPAAIIAHVKAGKPIHAWNAAFERVMWRNHMVKRHGWPIVNDRQWRCTMARAQSCGLPAALEEAGVALRLTEMKDLEGAKAMKKAMKPRKIFRDRYGNITDVQWWDDAALMQTVYAYCKQDVATECAAGVQLPHLSRQEQELYFVDQEMNDRGVRLDKELCENAIRIMEEAKVILDNRCRLLTGGKPGYSLINGRYEVTGGIGAGQRHLLQWIQRNGAPDLPNFQREVIGVFFRRTDIPDATREVLRIRLQYAMMASAKKFSRALEAVCRDGRLHGMMRFLGAAATGRWSSQLVQLQNLKKQKSPKEWPISSWVRIANFEGLEQVCGAPMQVVSDTVRSMLVASEGHLFYSADLSNIESRVLAEQAGQESILQAWRASDAGTGPDLYVIEAAKLFNKRPEIITDDERFWGKQEVLSLGFGGGAGALIRMVEKAGGDLRQIYNLLWRASSEQLRDRVMRAYNTRGEGDPKVWCTAQIIVFNWRANNPDIVKYWSLLERASITAVLHKGRKFAARKIVFAADDRWLKMRLPSGRVIRYAEPYIKAVQKFGRTTNTLFAKRVDPDIHQWRVFNPYGGFLSENATQGDARDVMAHRLPHLKAAGYNPVLTVHDEGLSEALRGDLNEYIKLVAQAPSWAPTLPVAAKGWCGPCYRK